MERVALEPGYILHHYPWRNSSLLVEVFTQSHGRLGLVARGARRPKSRLRGVLQPFRPVMLSWSLRGDLGTLTDAELASAPLPLAGARLLCAFYTNELLMRLVHRHDPHPTLFEHYANCLACLSASDTKKAAALRLFEKQLLDACGYGLNLEADVDTGEAVESDVMYDYVLEHGPRRHDNASARLAVSGATLRALAQQRLEDDNVLREAQRVLRASIDLYLGGKPLKTRQVLQGMRHGT